jgi:hypothetical protein
MASLLDDMQALGLIELTPDGDKIPLLRGHLRRKTRTQAARRRQPNEVEAATRCLRKVARLFDLIAVLPYFASLAKFSC